MTATNRDAPAVSVLGTLADGVVGSGDREGRLRLDAAGIDIDWWVGADDGWKLPARDGVHTIRPGRAPAIESRLRVPGGEVVLRAYAVAGMGGPVAVADLENASPGAAVVAWVVRGAPGYRVGRVAIEGPALLIDDRARLDLPRVPLRWAVAARSVGVQEAVVDGRASSGTFAPVATRRGDLEVALLFPVAHRTRTRIAASTANTEAVGVVQLPAPADVERGWDAALEGGTRVELPDQPMQAAVDAARATVLLGAHRSGRRDPAVATAAADWGLSDNRRSRRDARRTTDDPWRRVKAQIETSGSSPRHAAEWLTALRGGLVGVTREGLDLLPHFPDEWLGRPVAVHDLVTRRGPVSFALRWHGARPALLWDVPAGMSVRAPGLDRSWESANAAGEALLSEIDATRLLPLRAATGSDPGVIVDEPGSFT